MHDERAQCSHSSAHLPIRWHPETHLSAACEEQQRRNGRVEAASPAPGQGAVSDTAVFVRTFLQAHCRQLSNEKVGMDGEAMASCRTRHQIWCRCGGAFTKVLVPSIEDHCARKNSLVLVFPPEWSPKQHKLQVPFWIDQTGSEAWKRVRHGDRLSESSHYSENRTIKPKKQGATNRSYGVKLLSPLAPLPANHPAHALKHGERQKVGKRPASSDGIRGKSEMSPELQCEQVQGKPLGADRNRSNVRTMALPYTDGHDACKVAAN
eukprot:SAG31_NODE_3943_length_3730_cov_4.533462_2_plen_265_part_00